MKFIIKIIRFVVLHDSHVPVPTQTLVMTADWVYHCKGAGSAVGACVALSISSPHLFPGSNHRMASVWCSANPSSSALPFMLLLVK